MFRALAVSFVAFPLAVLAANQKPDQPTGLVPAKTLPSWIWLSDKPAAEETVYFRKEFEIKGFFTAARLHAACDNEMTIYLDGKEVGHSNDWQSPFFKDVSETLTAKNRGQGKHVIAVRGQNHGGPAGLVVRLVLDMPFDEPQAVVTDKGWRAADKADGAWTTVGFDDKGWQPAVEVGKLGGGPWGDRLNEKTLMAAAKLREPSATPAEQIKVAKDFKAELLYSVPKDTQGSWVNLCVDPRGRLIASDQYGPLYRITPPPLGAPASETKVEKLDLPLGGAHGLLWAFDSLYVMVNEGAKLKDEKGEPLSPKRGLHRARSKDGGDTFEKPEFLHAVEGSGEHGSHAVLLGPDGRSLYVLCGNMTKMVSPLAASRVPKVWGEDHLLPRMPDGNGFMAGVLGPGGCIYRVDPDGKSWELVSVGYRNPFDMAFNRHGELLTYDADMEWDMNTPWYRPTRVCLVTSGSEFGWRNGTGKWPPYYPDNLPGFF